MGDVAVTGFAWSTSLGDRIEPVWNALMAGATGIRPTASAHALRNAAAAAIPAYAHVSPRDRMAMLAEATVRAALDHAGEPEEAAAEPTYLVLGTSFGARLDDEASAAEPADAWVRDLADALGAVPVALSTACSSGSDAVLVGTELIRAGMASRCICGGVDVLTEAKRLAHTALGTMARGSLRSFDRDRGGTLLGEGAGVLVLEAAGTVGGRDVRAWVRGCGASNDAAGLTAPNRDGEGVKLAVSRCLAEAGLAPSQVEIINAHGSGTPTNDSVEAAAYSGLFGAGGPLIFATKGAFGHTLGATGALEAIAVIVALREGCVPPIFGLSDPAPECLLPLPGPWGSPAVARRGLSVTIGFGGFNTALLFERASA